MKFKESLAYYFPKEATGDLELEISPNKQGEGQNFQCLWKILERECWYVFIHTHQQTYEIIVKFIIYVCLVSLQTFCNVNASANSQVYALPLFDVIVI